MSVKNKMKENIDGSINTVFLVQKPYSGCELASLVKPIDPLLGIGAGHKIVPEKVHALFTDENIANKIAQNLYQEHLEEEKKLEEKKLKVESKLKKAITELERLRTENTNLLKEDPTNNEVKEEIANLTEKINAYLETLQKINESKTTKEKVEEGFLSNISARAKGTFAGASQFGKSIGSAFKNASDVGKAATVNEKIKNLDKEFTSFISDIDNMIENDKVPGSLKINLKKYKTELEKFEKANKKYIVEPEKEEPNKKEPNKKEPNKKEPNKKDYKNDTEENDKILKAAVDNKSLSDYTRRIAQQALDNTPQTPETKTTKAKPAEIKPRKPLTPPKNITKTTTPAQRFQAANKKAANNKKERIKESIINYLIKNK